jgi:hypothetical protein
MEVSGQLHSLVKERRYQFTGRLHGLQRRSDHFRQVKGLLLLSGIEPRFLGSPALGLVIIPTEPSWLSFLLILSLTYDLPHLSYNENCEMNTRGCIMVHGFYSQAARCRADDIVAA